VDGASIIKRSRRVTSATERQKGGHEGRGTQGGIETAGAGAEASLVQRPWVADCNTPACWNDAFPNQDGWLEIHPIDSIRFIDKRPSPLSGTPGAATSTKRSIDVNLCQPGFSASEQWLARPEGTYGSGTQRSGPPTTLVPHGVELIDGRFSTMSGVALHGAPQVIGDCAQISASLIPGSAREYFKATYLVWWTTQ
jgi:hypothetical protein